MHHLFTENLQSFWLNSKTPAESTNGMVDRIVEQGRLWRVKYMGTIWFARPYPSKEILTIQPGDVVNVMGRSGITLVVAPAQSLKAKV